MGPAVPWLAPLLSFPRGSHASCFNQSISEVGSAAQRAARSAAKQPRIILKLHRDVHSGHSCSFEQFQLPLLCNGILLTDITRQKVVIH